MRWAWCVCGVMESSKILPAYIHITATSSAVCASSFFSSKHRVPMWLKSEVLYICMFSHCAWATELSVYTSVKCFPKPVFNVWKETVKDNRFHSSFLQLLTHISQCWVHFIKTFHTVRKTEVSVIMFNGFHDFICLSLKPYHHQNCICTPL